MYYTVDSKALVVSSQMFLFALSGQSPTPPSLSLGGRDSLHLSPSLSLVKEVARTVNAD